jgi:hypothetical protein
LEIVVNSHPDAAATAPAWPVFYLQAQAPHHTPFYLGHEAMCLRRAVREALSPLLDRTKGELKSPGDDAGAIEDLRDSL